MAILKASCAVFLLLVTAAAVYGMKGSLHDNNFEHTTQASTGQTTGIWYAAVCKSTGRQGCVIELHLNVARVFLIRVERGASCAAVFFGD